MPTSTCRAVTLPRRDTGWNLQGCPKIPDRSQPLVGRSSPYCVDICRTYCCLVSFFPIVNRCLSCEDIARETCAIVRRWTDSEFCTWQNSVRRQDIPKVYIYCTRPGDGHTSRKVWLASAGKRRRWGNEGKTRNPLKFVGGPKLAHRSQPLVGRSSPYYGYMWRTYCCLTSFFSDCRYMP